ncbi:hypothetical protein CP8484711_0034B, partial [Chlamydia psittaci 84-8471/1]
LKKLMDLRIIKVLLISLCMESQILYLSELMGLTPNRQITA